MEKFYYEASKTNRQVYLSGLRASKELAISEKSRYNLQTLIYEWNVQDMGYRFPHNPTKVPQVFDETCRDGLQSTTVKHPTAEQKAQLVRWMCVLGIDAVNLGFPAATPVMYEDSYYLAKTIRDKKLSILPYCLARTMIPDIEKIVEISQKLNFGIHAFLFIGSSPIRQFVENWKLPLLLKRTSEAVRFAVSHGLPTMFFTEDTTRSHPDVLKALWETAIDAGATRIGIADTVGYANPNGASQIVKYCRRVIAGTGKEVQIDWHGHNDRGLGVANSLAALDAGANRVHGCALGIGERVGNTNMEQLLVNLKLNGYSGFVDRNFTALRDYVNLVSEACEVPVPHDYPIVGENAFRTSTGIHAAAVIKAQSMGGDWLANRVYSAVPAEEIGLKQRIEVGPQSGKSNVQHWLVNHGYSQQASNEALVNHILRAVKKANGVFEDSDLHQMIRAFSQQKREKQPA